MTAAPAAMNLVLLGCLGCGAGGDSTTISVGGAGRGVIRAGGGTVGGGAGTVGSGGGVGDVSAGVNASTGVPQMMQCRSPVSREPHDVQ